MLTIVCDSCPQMLNMLAMAAAGLEYQHLFKEKSLSTNFRHTIASVSIITPKEHCDNTQKNQKHAFRIIWKLI